MVAQHLELVHHLPPLARHVPRAAGVLGSLRLLRGAGLRKLVRFVRTRVWSTNVSFGLRVDLDRIPEVRPARVEVRMQPYDAATFRGFTEEHERIAGGLELVQRQRLGEAGVRTLYVAHDGAGEPIYAQWLVREHEQEALHRATAGLFPELEQGEALVEGAYTFASFRKLGVMADGMRQLLVRARELGDHAVYTYVAGGNVPSLRGCANVGFVPDHLRFDVCRLGYRRSRRAPLDAAARSRWEAAVSADAARAAQKSPA